MKVLVAATCVAILVYVGNSFITADDSRANCRHALNNGGHSDVIYKCASAGLITMKDLRK